MFKVYPIGGYSEVGKNMTAVEFEDDVIIFDLGLFIPPIIQLGEEDEFRDLKKFRQIGAVPDDLILDNLGLRKKVRAILLSHAHLDHIGAIPFLAHRYDAEIIGTPFTTSVMKKLLEDDKIKLKNKIKVVQPNSSYTIKGKKKNYQVDFVNITHSTIQASLIALHTDDGIILYANDFKFDNNPIVGKKPNYEKMKELSKKGVKLLIVDSLYSGEDRKTPSEKIARALLEDVMLTTDNSKSAIVVTTFSSHIARLKSIVDFSKRLNRKPIFIGRSLRKYTSAAINVKLCPFKKDILMLSYGNQIRSMMKKIEKNREKYVIVCTGHQGEPGSVLERISRDEFPFKLRGNDHVIFASKTIPTTENKKNREIIGQRLKKKDLRVFDEVHVSGHAAREDLRDFLNMIKPEIVIPAHGSKEQLDPMVELANELGYSKNSNTGKRVLEIRDAQSIKIL